MFGRIWPMTRSSGDVVTPEAGSGLRTNAIAAQKDRCPTGFQVLGSGFYPGSGLWGQPLHEDFHHSAADLVLAVDRVGQVDEHQARAAVFVRGHRLGQHLGLTAAAADRAAEAAVGADEHARAGPPRRRSASPGYRRNDSGLAGRERLLKLAEHFVHYANGITARH